MFQAARPCAQALAPVKNVRRARDKLDAYLRRARPRHRREPVRQDEDAARGGAKWLKGGGVVQEAFKQKLPVYAHARECNDRRTTLQNRIDPVCPAGEQDAGGEPAPDRVAGHQLTARSSSRPRSRAADRAAVVDPERVRRDALRRGAG